MQDEVTIEMVVCKWCGWSAPLVNKKGKTTGWFHLRQHTQSKHWAESKEVHKSAQTHPGY